MSEQTLDLLIDRLKKEALDQAEKESAALLSEARAKAKAILAEAEEEKRSIQDQAEREAQELVERGQNALRVAARDLGLAVRNDLIGMLRATLEKEVDKQFDPDLLRAVIERVVGQLDSEVAFGLPAEHQEELAQFILQRFRESRQKITVLERRGTSSGLTITKTDQGWSYDITPDQISEALLPLLHARWAEILNDTPSA